jgi:hypothetical protein
MCGIPGNYYRCAADRRQANSHGLRPESKAEIARSQFARDRFLSVPHSQLTGRNRGQASCYKIADDVNPVGADLSAKRPVNSTYLLRLINRLRGQVRSHGLASSKKMRAAPAWRSSNKIKSLVQKVPQFCFCPKGVGVGLPTIAPWARPTEAASNTSTPVRQTCRIPGNYYRCAADRRQANSHGLRPESKAEIARSYKIADDVNPVGADLSAKRPVHPT